jgi:hypothetical protein
MFDTSTWRHYQGLLLSFEDRLRDLCIRGVYNQSGDDITEAYRIALQVVHEVIDIPGLVRKQLDEVHQQVGLPLLPSGEADWRNRTPEA